MSGSSGKSGVSGGSSVSLDRRMEELGLDKDFLIVECGCSNYTVLKDENLLDQFLVLKSILDRNLPKLVESDIKILRHICLYVFPEIPSPEIENTNEIKSMVEYKLEQKYFHKSEDSVQNVLNIHSAIGARHGVMIVGPPISGKTQATKTYTDALERLHKREFNEKYVAFMLKKGERLGIATKSVLKDGLADILPEDSDPIAEAKFKMTPEEYQLLLDTCKYKGISNIIVNPKSINPT